jgi:hypothetical protein
MNRLANRDLEHWDSRAPGVLLTTFGVLLALLWQGIRWPLLAGLIVLEPVLRLVLCGVALAALLTAGLMRFAVERPAFPFWGTLALSVSAVLILIAYHAVIRLLSPGRPGRYSNSER